MNEHEAQQDPCYKRNYLTQVIARVDFLAPVDSMEKKLPDKIIKSLKQSFPLVEPKKITANQLMISAKDHKLVKQHSMLWNLHGENRDKVLTITSDYAYIEYKTFKNYQTLRQEFEAMCEVLLESFEEIGSKRLGLRYINNIRPQEEDPLAWGDYINNDMLHLTEFRRYQNYLSRLMNVIEYKFDEMNLRYQFGMHNPDYPSRIKQKVFVLDLDGYIDIYHTLRGITPQLDILHSKIQELFEHSITQKFREHLDA